MKAPVSLPIGACFLPGGKARFRVWAPACSRVDVKILQAEKDVRIPLKKQKHGYYSVEVKGLKEGTLYQYRLNDERERPDPASRFQPQGVHGPSALVNPSKFKWDDATWKGIPFRDLILYELHTGLFTPSGTFEGIIRKIPHLKKLGATCVELMPVAQFPGNRNWGYDGVNLFAPQNTYGGPDGLKKLVNACHQAGLAVCLDVVYNHLGPEGNYLSEFGPYFTPKYHTPWGEAVNYDGAGSREVRKFIIANALYWVEEFHVDVLRLDAVHCIYDGSHVHILEELNAEIQILAKKLKRQVHVIAESDLNDPKIVRDKKQGGYGLAGQWSDDFHHSLHRLLTHEEKGYYQDYGKVEDLEKSIREGFVYEGQYSRFRKKSHGKPAKGIPPEKFVICIQNHDQIGNRAFGERLGSLTSWNKQKLAASLLLLSANTPLLFMGQEYGERKPFIYFMDFGDPHLREAVRQGRRREFAAFGWRNLPDPSCKKAARNSRLDWGLIRKKKHADLLAFYRRLIKLRKKYFTGSRLLGTRFLKPRKILLLDYELKSGKKARLAASFSEKLEWLKGIAPGRKQKIRPFSIAFWGESGLETRR